MKGKISIIKNNGETEFFSPVKLQSSLTRNGASKSIAQFVLSEVEKKLHDGITTKKIYSLAFQLFWKKSHYHATTYNLKKSVMALGPSGFHFEKFIGHLFEGKGFKSSLNNMRQGKCVKHEVDVVARRDDFTVFAECKFHNSPSKKNDIKTALYVQARSLDLQESSRCENFDEFWLISNTCFSKDAIQYASCSGLKLFGFNYPKQNTIGDIVNRYRLHPITCLRKLKKTHMQKLLEKNIVLVKQIYRYPELLMEVGVDEENFKSIMREIKMLVMK